MLTLNTRLVRRSRQLEPVWTLIAKSLRLKSRPDSISAPQRIVVFNLHLIGDAVMLIPLLRLLRRVHPTAHLALVAGPWAEPLLSGSGLMDEFIALRAPWIVPGGRLKGYFGVLRALRTLRRQSWDWAIETRGDVRNILLMALAKARRRIGYDFSGGAALLTDVVEDDGRLKHIIEHHGAIGRHLGMDMTAEERVPRLLTRASHASGSRKRIGFHFGASLALRQMPLAEARALLLNYQQRQDCRLTLFDAPDTRALNSQLLAALPADFASRIERWSGNLAQFKAALELLDRLYAMDSGPAHLAAALGVDTVVFFGPNIARGVQPLGRRVTVIEPDGMACRPCEQRSCTNPVRQQCLVGIARRAASLAGP